jgi:transposase InsO family protein
MNRRFKLENAGIQPSMSRPGCPYDNAMAESFMKTLKAKEVNGTDDRNIGHARSAIGKFLEEVYNRQRLNSALNYLSPEEFELAALTTTASAEAASVNPLP